MPIVVKLEPSLDLQATGRLAEALGEARGAVVLDGSAVVHVGGLAAQLILSCHAAGGPGGKGLRLADPSPGCAAGLRRLGVDPAMLA